MTDLQEQGVSKVNILLVDDNDAVRMVLSILLGVHDEVGEVREASDGMSAVDICAGFRPDVVVLDFWMPVMDGAETAEKIRSLHPDVKIVAYSAVLETIPPWADALFVKDDIPDPDYLIDLAVHRGQEPESNNGLPRRLEVDLTAVTLRDRDDQR